MRRNVTFTALVAVALVAMLSGLAEAGPFGRRAVATSSTATCTSGNCGTSSTTERSRTVLRGSNATAQAVAELQASNGAMAHHGGNSGFEGVGYGSTPEAALAACCNNGRAVIDQGVARSANGRWYACKRYSR
jgi:hypothetical protein